MINDPRPVNMTDAMIKQAQQVSVGNNPNTPKDELDIEELVSTHASTVDRWLKKGHGIGTAYAEANREALASLSAYMAKNRTNLITQLRKERVVDADAEYDCGFNAGIDTAIEVLRGEL